MTYAKNFNAATEALKRNRKGFYHIPSGFISAWRNKAMRVEYPFGKDSLDPSERWYFADGSCVHIGNPRQWAYPLSVTVLN